MRAFNWGSQEGEDKHGTRLGTPDTGYTLAEAEICNVLEHKVKIISWSVINIAPLTLNSVCNAFDGLMALTHCKIIARTD